MVDQIGKELVFEKTPKRIVSLVPSQTELIVDLGLHERLIGITKFCIHPEDLRIEKAIVGGTKQVHYDQIADLNPDIILCNKEENTEEMVAQLEAIASVHVSDICTLNDTLDLIRQYGAVFNVQKKAEVLASRIEEEARAFKLTISSEKRYSCLYFIWRNPWMTAGKSTFIDYVLDYIGFDNVIVQSRYPEVTLEELPVVDYIFLSSEPFPFNENHSKEIEQYSDAKIVLIDGEYFSWYGSRLLNAFAYFKKLREQLEL